MADLVPDSTIAAGGWKDQVGGSTNLHAPLGDDNKLTWAQSPTNPANAILKLGVQNPLSVGAGDVEIFISAVQIAP